MPRGLIILALLMLLPSTVGSGSYKYYLLNQHVIERTVVKIVGLSVLKQQEELNNSVKLLELLNKKIKEKKHG